MLTHKAKRRKIFYRMNETGASDKIMVGSFFGSMDILALHTSAAVPGWQVVDTVPPSVYPTNVTFLSTPCHHLHQNLMQCYQRSFLGNSEIGQCQMSKRRRCHCWKESVFCNLWIHLKWPLLPKLGSSCESNLEKPVILIAPGQRFSTNAVLGCPSHQP